MSLAEFMSAVAVLPPSDKEQLWLYLNDELKAKKPSYSPQPQDNCPYTEEQIRNAFAAEGGRTLKEILRSEGLR